jgi:hypothetical protein
MQDAVLATDSSDSPPNPDVSPTASTGVSLPSRSRNAYRARQISLIRGAEQGTPFTEPIAVVRSTIVEVVRVELPAASSSKPNAPRVNQPCPPS